jgi:hypothetical protein
MQQQSACSEALRLKCLQQGAGIDRACTYCQVWILGRIYAGNNETDLAAAKAVQNNITITPLFPDNYVLPTNLTDLAQLAVQAALTPSAGGVSPLNSSLVSCTFKLFIALESTKIQRLWA